MIKLKMYDNHSCGWWTSRARKKEFISTHKRPRFRFTWDEMTYWQTLPHSLMQLSFCITMISHAILLTLLAFPIRRSRLIGLIQLWRKTSMISLNLTKFNLKLCFPSLNVWPYLFVFFFIVAMVIAEFSFKLKKFSESGNLMEIYDWYGNHFIQWQLR